jgi:hypothetical protein
VPREFDSVCRPVLEGLLEPGETLQGVIAATRQKAFGGRLYGIGVTDRRLILQPLDRRIEPVGDTVSLPPGQIASAEADGAGGGWWNETAVLMDHAALRLRLRTVNGGKWKLTMMRGGEGGLGRLGGGASQKAGIEALAAWFERRAAGGPWAAHRPPG